jgi:NADH-quinone oxidoreductase subunit L
LDRLGHAEEIAVNTFVMGASIAAGVLGILLAGLFYRVNPTIPEKIGAAFRPLYRLSFNKFWFDEIYAAWIVKPFHFLGRALFSFDQSVVDGSVNGTGYLTVAASRIQNWIDKTLVDGLVNFTGYTAQFASAALRRIQTGFIQNYLLILFLGILVLIAVKIS